MHRLLVKDREINYRFVLGMFLGFFVITILDFDKQPQFLCQIWRGPTDPL